MSFQQRISKLASQLAANQFDAMIVHDGNNMRYLSGFTGGTGDGLLVVSTNKAFLITDARYTEEYQNHLPENIDFVETRNYLNSAVEILEKNNVTKVAFENDLPYNLFQQLSQLTKKDSFNVEPLFPEFLIELQREQKDEQEIDKLIEATKRSVTAFNQLIEKIEIGMSERQVVNLLDQLARNQGLEKASFDTIVASGTNSAKPHAIATDKKLAEGELVTIDFGYYFDGYTSDITRTLALGDISDELKEIYEIVKKAKEKAVDVIQVGTRLNEVDRVARQYIDQKGFGRYFEHGTGHGVGLAIHEGPVVSSRSDNKVEAAKGNLLTIEPGIYLPEKGGVRIEDDILINLDGSISNLTSGITTELIMIKKGK